MLSHHFFNAYRQNERAYYILPTGGIIRNNEHIEERTVCAIHNNEYIRGTKLPSDEELVVLNDMREIKARVKKRKKRQSEIFLDKGEYLEEKSRLEKEMTELKTDPKTLY
ncbi:MAG: hypothetical protein JW896_01690 [Deltaproteobacteria bacterium]|nr:hypothetical protein [Deltaproteobacteria bacterium]